MPIKRIIWKHEERLGKPLELVYGAHRVFAKVRMVDVIASEDPRLTPAERDYLFKAHFDFVVVDENYVPIAVCELDGASHLFRKQAARDEKKEAICDKAELPLWRFHLDMLKQIESTASSANLDQPLRDYKEVVAEIIRFYHEAEFSSEFGKLVVWMADSEKTREHRTFVRAIQYHTVSELIELVREKGAEETIKEMQFYMSWEDFATKVYHDSGLTEEQWDKCGVPAFNKLWEIYMDRAEANDISLIDYLDSFPEAKPLLHLFQMIVGSWGDNESTFKESLDTLCLLFSLRQACYSEACKHPDQKPMLVSELRDLADAIERSNLDDLMDDAKWYSVGARYSESVRQTQHRSKEADS